VFGLRLQMWPVFQKAMTEHIESLKKLAGGASNGYFSRSVTTTDAAVSGVRLLSIVRAPFYNTSYRSASDISRSSTRL
jgi:hypothetical protein